MERARAEATTRSSFRSLFRSPIKTLPGPPWTATGEPGALVNTDCGEALEGALPEGHEIKYDDAIINKLKRPKRLIVTGILITEVIASLLSSGL